MNVSNVFCQLLFIWSLLTSIIAEINSGDNVLEFPYSTKQRTERSVPEECDQYSYGQRPHVKVLAHIDNTIEKNVTLTTKQAVTPTQPSNSATSIASDIFSTKSHITGVNSRPPYSTSGSSPTPSSKGTTTTNNKETFILTNISIPNIETHHLTATVGSYWNERSVFVHVAYINNPLKTLSVYEPLQDGTCRQDGGDLATVLESAQARGCVLAVNAGLFNTTSGKCYGNIVSDGRQVQDSEGIQNAHFGITKDGSLFFGYLSEIDIVAERFQQLVGGVMWVLKDGQDYVDTSIATECPDTEETGTLQRFASVISARTLVGSDQYGRVMIIQIDGKTDKTGASLYEAAEIMRKLGAVHAINLDGGGSSTLVINNTLVSYPSDWCGDYQCMRNVTTILCAHEPLCNPGNCGGHGDCIQGHCNCHGFWTGSACDVLKCSNSCNGNGVCTEDGCLCFPGYHGDDCDKVCEPGWHGDRCRERCVCEHGASCHPVDGSCSCGPGYQGTICQYRCPYGHYGANCSSVCLCENLCHCDHVTGSCNVSSSNTPDPGGGLCQIRIQQEAAADGNSQRYYISAIIGLSVLLGVSVIMNLVFLQQYCKNSCHRSKPITNRRRASGTYTLATHAAAKLLLSGTQNSSFTTSTTSDEETMFIRK